MVDILDLIYSLLQSLHVVKRISEVTTDENSFDQQMEQDQGNNDSNQEPETPKWEDFVQDEDNE